MATNGVEAAAGSAPNRFKKMGSMEPKREPHNTTDNNEKPITSASRKIFSPKVGKNKFHINNEAMPKTQSVKPNRKPETNSRFMIRHQSFMETSFSAMA